MTFEETAINGVYLVEPELHRDHRGFFAETYRDDLFEQMGVACRFSQTNFSRSCYGTVRGLHYRDGPRREAKLVGVARGRIWDVVVDLRHESTTYSQWIGIWLDDASPRRLYIPPGCAHGFYAASDEVDLIYQVSALWEPGLNRSIRWDSPKLAIDWPLVGKPIMSQQDREAPLFDGEAV